MKVMDNLLDAYNLRARLFPAFLVLAPVGLGVAAWFPLDYQLLGTLGSLGATLGVATLLQQLARDAGKRQGGDLFDQWGGPPSVQLLSYAASGLNRQTLARYHTKLGLLCPELKLPATPEEELARSADARIVYGSANDYLLNNTRDKEKFSLLFEENMNYGFRRNLLGLKSHGVVCVLAGAAACAARLAWDWRTGAAVSEGAAGYAAVCVVLLVVWLRVINDRWVRRAADAYARRLVACCDQLEVGKQG